MYYLRAECKNPNCEKQVLIAAQGYKDRFAAEIALLDIQRREIMNQLINSKWQPSDFQQGVKAFDHPIPKDIQANSILVHCGDGCLRTYLYSSGDVFMVWESE